MTLSRPVSCPLCLEALTDEQVKAIWGSWRGRRQTPHAGPGRPRGIPNKMETLTDEQRIARARKAGLASAAARRKRV